MKKITPRVKYIFMLFLAAAMFFVSCKKDTIPTDNPDPVVTGPDLIFYGVTSAGQLAKYNAMNPGTAISSVAISGLHTGESILAVGQYDRWVEIYPAVDVWQTLLRIKSWAEANPCQAEDQQGHGALYRLMASQRAGQAKS